MSIHLLKDVLCKIFHIPSLFGMDLYSSVMNSLRYAFQSQTKLCLVMDFFNGGELFHYLSMGRFSEVSKIIHILLCRIVQNSMLLRLL